ncbi:DUF6261 family protein [Capnocytophaga sp.]|uniref:DUF6261 family protein n=1 Tax=Capnocytophaga sp. TaxID=44737 RepID=UPI0026DDBA39|nr:DUF6261 family protein [Capnocytophaga sp.]MDO5105206.1 DUF6261 family protein [Capnocytophaga sp.]
MKQMIQIRSVNDDRLNINEYAHFLKSVLMLIERTTLEQINLEKEVYDRLEKYLDELTEATGQVRSNKETRRISELDKKRGEYLVFLLSCFRVEQNNTIPERKEAALLLYKSLKMYAGTQSLPLAQKTQGINGFLYDIRKPEMKPHTAVLGVESTIAALDNINKEYQELAAKRAKDQLENKLINTRKLRKEIMPVYRYVVDCAEATYLLYQTEESAYFLNSLNKLVADTVLAYKRRQPKSTLRSKQKESESKKS